MKPFLVIVAAHGKAQATFDRHLPFWRRHQTLIKVVCPKDDLVKVPPDIELITEGFGQHSGAHSDQRMQRMLELAEGRRTIIYEYDSICLEPEKLDLCDGLLGNVHLNTDKRFVAPRYVNPPWSLDGQSTQQMLEVRMRYPDVKENFHDRTISALAHLAGVPILDYLPVGYSNDTLTWRDKWGIAEMIGHGGTMIHGIKSERQLQDVLEMWSARGALRKLNELTLDRD